MRLSTISTTRAIKNNLPNVSPPEGSFNFQLKWKSFFEEGRNLSISFMSSQMEMINEMTTTALVICIIV